MSDYPTNIFSYFASVCYFSTECSKFREFAVSLNGLIMGW